MTMPEERTRAIRFGFEMLDEVVVDHELPQDVRQRAELVLRNYPRPEDLAKFLTLPPSTLPLTWASALMDAHVLFKDIRRFPGASTAITRSLEVTLRHFPEESLVWLMTRTPDLADWLAPERRRDA